MDSTKDSLSTTDKDRIFGQLHDHSVAIASLQSGVEGLASSTSSGFASLENQISALGRSMQAQRPQIGVIATFILSAFALLGAVAGFALKSSIVPLDRDLEAHKVLTATVRTFYDNRITELERKMQNRVSDSDDVQNQRLEALEKFNDEFNKILLHSYSDRILHRDP